MKSFQNCLKWREPRLEIYDKNFPNFFGISTLLSYLNRHTENQHPKLSISLRKIREGVREREREINNTVNRGHFVCHAARLQCHPSSARTPLGPIFSLSGIGLEMDSIVFIVDLLAQPSYIF